LAAFSTFWAGFVVFIICCTIGLVMAFWGGGFIDRMIDMQSDLPGSTSDFAADTEDQVYWFVNLYYFVMYCIPILGAVIWGQAIIKRVRESQYSYR